MPRKDSVLEVSSASQFPEINKDLEEDGRWVTIQGRAIFIKKGQSVQDAMDTRYKAKGDNTSSKEHSDIAQSHRKAAAVLKEEAAKGRARYGRGDKVARAAEEKATSHDKLAQMHETASKETEPKKESGFIKKTAGTAVGAVIGGKIGSAIGGTAGLLAGGIPGATVGYYGGGTAGAVVGGYAGRKMVSNKQLVQINRTPCSGFPEIKKGVE